MFVILEGLDRTGKTTVADIYKNKGFEVIHLSAPSKKYTQPGYSGPSYLDEMLELYVSKSGVDVIWDRSIYGELVWSPIYNRNALLSEEDIEILREIEAQNTTQYILMHDPDIEAHWDRCVQNREPLTKAQFIHANRLYAQLKDKYGFEKKTLNDFVENISKPTDATIEVAKESEDTKPMEVKKMEQEITPEQKRLMQANAINDVLSARILKKKGDFYDVVENKIRNFLNNELSVLIGMNASTKADFSPEEILFLKTLIKQAQKKHNN